MRLPAEVADKAREFADSGAEPATPRDSATVMLLRAAADGGGPEVYMLRRRRSMAFAAGAYVFPGGSVDSRDSDGELSWAGPSVEDWATALGCPPGLARGLVCAAVRETFEEAGVLLAGARTGDPAGPSASGPSASGPSARGPSAAVPSAPGAAAAVPSAAVPSAIMPAGDELEPDRLALLDRSLSLAEMLGRRNLVLRTDLLKPWARWVTPDLEPRRFDTRFFAAMLPAGQQTADIREEADQVTWLRPAEALAAAARHEVMLMPPTAVTLAELAACPDIAAVFATERRVTPRQPVITLEDGQAWLSLPDGLEFPHEQVTHEH